MCDCKNLCVFLEFLSFNKHTYNDLKYDMSFALIYVSIATNKIQKKEDYIATVRPVKTAYEFILF